MFKKNCQKIGIYKSTITILRYIKTTMEADELQTTNLSISTWSALSHSHTIICTKRVLQLTEQCYQITKIKTMHSIFLCALIKEQLLSLTSALCLIQLEELYAVLFFRRAELTLCGKKWFFFLWIVQKYKKMKEHNFFFETGMFALMTTQESDPLHPFYFRRHSSQTLTLTYSCLPHSWNKFTGMPWEEEHVAKTVSVFDLTLEFSLPFPAAFLKIFYIAVHNMGLPFLNHKFLSIRVTVFVWSTILTYFTRTESWKEHRIQLCITALLFSWQSSLNIFRMVVTVLDVI